MPMVPRDVIRAQLETLRQELLRAKHSAKVAEIEEKLRVRVEARFDTELTRLEKKADALLVALKSSQPLTGRWQGLRELQADASKVLDECLAFVQGALARKVALDQGICALTDLLLDDLAACSDVPWGRFTLLSTSEFYRETAEIIRIRYPEVSLWSMPFAAHEFGHFIGPALRRNRAGGFEYPFQEMLRSLDEGSTAGSQGHSSDWHHVGEYFSDLFGTYTLGPAYAAAFITLRMNPGEAYAETYTHPPGAFRVHGILWTLEKMADRDASLTWRPFGEVTTLLRGLWTDSLQEVGQPVAIPDAAASLVCQRMSDLFDLLVDTTPGRLAFGGAAWNRVEVLAADLSPKDLPQELSRRDVLNAAWLARLGAADQDSYSLNGLAGAALATYRRVGPLQPS